MGWGLNAQALLLTAGRVIDLTGLVRQSSCFPGKAERSAYAAPNGVILLGLIDREGGFMQQVRRDCVGGGPSAPVGIAARGTGPVRFY